MSDTAYFWIPDLRNRRRPHYLAIADAIAEDIRSGKLTPADQLPPQRLLAELLGLDFTTVARGYVEAQRRGLIESRVGRGTFIRASAVPRNVPGSRRPDLIDFSMNLPPEPDDPALLERMRRGLAEVGRDLMALMRYQGFGGSSEDKDAAVRWLSRRGLAVNPESLLICPGAHSALLAIMGAVCKPGDALCAEELTYPGARALAAHLGRPLIGLPMDAEGVDADAFADACERHAPSAIYLNPTLLNPTTVTISARRREAIIAVARRYQVVIIEDDAYGFIPAEAPPTFFSLAPDITYYVAGLAKCLGAGLRLAYLIAPNARAAFSLSAALRAATVMASPLTAGLATRWINDNTADAVLAGIRAESAARQTIAAEILPAGSFQANPAGFHLWLSLPEPWRRSNFAAQLRSSGIGIVASDAFAVAEPIPEAVRVCLGGAATRAEVKRALELIAHTMHQAPAMASAFI